MINIKDLKIHLLKDSNQYLEDVICQKLKIKRNALLKYEIIKKSIDARNQEIYYVYEVDVDVKGNVKHHYAVAPNRQYHYQMHGQKKIDGQIVIVGSGPAGLFCAYLLALNHYHPLVIERGKPIPERIKDVSAFWEDNCLNVQSNIAFGEGGAGTFSDGKLNSLVKDHANRQRFVLETFVKFGAPPEIMYLHNPHIGTDVLRDVIVKMRQAIINLGGIFRFETCLTDLIIKDEKLEGIVVNDQEVIKTNALVLAIGHSARDTYKMLDQRHVKMNSKPFAVGLRIQLPQSLINENQYGKYAKFLEPASFKLTNHVNNRAVYSFCMCPGGYVINASSEEKRLVINGMSDYRRDSGIANAALVVSVNENDYGHDLFGGMHYQEKLEEQAFRLGKGLIPTSTIADYLNNQPCQHLGKINPCFKGGYQLCDLNLLFNKEINDCIKASLAEFSHKINNFNHPEHLLSGVETRTSSPVRIVRDEHMESNIKGLYPIGEGAGYAGGITTAAVDGMKVFENLVMFYKN